MVGGDVAVVDDHDARAVVAHGGCRLVREALDGSPQSVRALVDRERGVEDDRGEGAAARVVELLERRREHEERREREQTCGAGPFGEQRRARPEQRAKAHHRTLADRVDRRVRDLGEALPQEVVDRARPRGERRQRGVVAHGEGGLVGVAGHGLEHHRQLLLRVAVGDLALDEVVGRGEHGIAGREGVEAVGCPTGVGRPRGQGLLDLGVQEHPAGIGVHQHDLARTQAPATHGATARHVDGAHLRRAHHESVLADLPPQGPQAVAVEQRADPSPVGEDDAGGSVPRFHQRRVVAVEALHVGRQVAARLPRVGDEHGEGVVHGTPTAGEQLERLVELGGVGAARIEHRPELVLGAETRGLGPEHVACLHAVLVAPDRVDLAVVAQHAERLGSLPGGQGVRGEALVEHRERSDDALVGEVEVEVGQLVGRGEPLVDDGAVRAGRDVDVGHLCRDAATQAVGGPLVVVGGELRGRAGGPGDDRLQDPGLARAGEVAEGVVVGGRGPPLGDGGTCLLDDPGDGVAGVLAAGEQRDDAVAVTEQGGGDGQEQARPVAAAGVGRERAAVLHVGQTGDRRGDDRPGRASLRVGDEADPAGVELSIETGT